MNPIGGGFGSGLGWAVGHRPDHGRPGWAGPDGRATERVPVPPAPSPTPPGTEPLPVGTTAPTAAAPAAAASSGYTASAASYSFDLKAGLRLVTQEGDVVRIRLRQSEGFEARSASTGAAAYAEVSSYTRSRFSIDVQGALSEEELTAISGVLGQVDALTRSFYSGDVAAAFADGAALDFDPAVLADVAVRVTQTEQIRVAVASSTLSGPSVAAPTVAMAPEAEPMPAPARLPASDGEAAAAPSASVAPRTADPRGTIVGFLSELVGTLGEVTQAGRLTLSARAKLDLAVLAIDGARAPAAPEEQAAASLLGAVVARTQDA
jgi:hypothetical protein